MTIEQLTTFFVAEVPKEITSTRFDHSIRVAEIAETLANSLGYHAPEKAFLAGIVHDITKQKKNEFHISLLEKYGVDYQSMPERAWHSHTGALYLVDKYKFADEEILSAVRNHTLGGANLPLLDKILYTADFLGSDYVVTRPELHIWIQQSCKDIHQGLILKSSNIIRELLTKKEKIHYLTINTYNDALNKLGKPSN
jgi:predicted HD superfamily hydrolase involved in NAD metabolism